MLPVDLTRESRRWRTPGPGAADQGSGLAAEAADLADAHGLVGEQVDAADDVLERVPGGECHRQTTDPQAGDQRIDRNAYRLPGLERDDADRGRAFAERLSLLLLAVDFVKPVP